MGKPPGRVPPPSKRAPAADSGLDAHCRRVAAVAAEIARRLRLPDDTQKTVEQAARLHHYPLSLLEGVPLDRLMADLMGGPGWQRFRSRVGLRDLVADVKAVLKALSARLGSGAKDRIGVMAGIVEAASLFTEALEYLPYEYQTVDQILNELRALSAEGALLEDVVRGLASLPRAPREDLLDAVYRLPVFPGVALRALEPAAEERLGLAHLFEIASSDTGLASALLRVANSGLYSPPRTIASVRQAIEYIGVKAARKVLMASVLRPFFAPVKITEMWRHSLRMAQFVERLAVISGRADPKEAFLAGLVHDAGRLAMDKMTGEVSHVRARMLEKRCEPVFVEKLLCRFDHGELGADILHRWNFPQSICEAVQFHHEPERTSSDFAALIYLGEYWSASEEDLPSASRLRRAMDRTRITAELMQSADSRNGLLDSLIHAA